jgi:hypothetical protein
LNQELGNDAVLPSKKVKKAKDKLPSKESIEYATKISKSAKKKINQIEQRKIREVERSLYFEKLNKYKIDGTHRDLLKSTKEIGQSLTNKMMVKRLYHKYKLGLSLSSTESNILFLEPPSSPIDFDKLDIVNKPENETNHQPIPIKVLDLVNRDDNSLLIDINSVIQPCDDNQETNCSRKKRKKNPNKSDEKASNSLSKTTSECNQNDNNSIPANHSSSLSNDMKSTQSLGSKLLEQFQILKDNLANNSKYNKTEPIQFIQDNHEIASNLEQEVSPKPSYIPVEINLDNIISEMGQVQTNHSKDQVNHSIHDSLVAREYQNRQDDINGISDMIDLTRRTIPVYRDSSIQV